MDAQKLPLLPQPEMTFWNEGSPPCIHPVKSLVSNRQLATRLPATRVQSGYVLMLDISPFFTCSCAIDTAGTKANPKAKTQLFLNMTASLDEHIGKTATQVITI